MTELQQRPTLEEKEKEKEQEKEQQQPTTEEPQQEQKEEEKEEEQEKEEEKEEGQEEREKPFQEARKHEDPVKKRIKAYRAALEPIEGTTMIDIGLIRKLAFDGIPDQAGLRGIYWKLLLDYLPPDKSLWEETLKARRKSYYELKNFFIIKPSTEDTEDCCDHVNTRFSQHSILFKMDYKLVFHLLSLFITPFHSH